MEDNKLTLLEHDIIIAKERRFCRTVCLVLLSLLIATNIFWAVLMRQRHVRYTEGSYVEGPRYKVVHVVTAHREEEVEESGAV